MEHFDVVVIGGGTAGLVTASGCARLGRKVALIEREALGGDCLWTGCVPTKALVSSAKLAHQMRNAEAWGLASVEPQLSPQAVMDSMRRQRALISRHDDPEKFRKLGIDVIEGKARLTGGGGVTVGERHLAARDIVLATGARTAVPAIDGLNESGWIDHASFLSQNSFPASVLILGGGAIGIEFAQIFARFGSRVTVVESEEAILAKEDGAIAARVKEMLIAEGIEVITGRTVKSVRREGPLKVAVTEPSKGCSPMEIEVAEIFLASGRRGNVEDLGLEKAGVNVERSWIVTDRYLRTTAPRVWACGDIHGGLQFTHVAGYEAVKVVRNMLFPGKSAVDYSHVPWVLYTDPEAAHLGMTEDEARAVSGDGLRIYETEMHDVDRAVIDRAERGLIKLICDAKGRILGAHILGAGASTMIEEIVLARRSGMKIGELAQRISPYPSLADGVQKAASLHYQELSKGWLGAVGRTVARWSQ